MPKVLGIDEAGRGPVIGSMFIGGYMVAEEDLSWLEEIGVKDSKKLKDERRESIAEKLRSKGEIVLKELEASEIDELRNVMTINEIELQAFAGVIEEAEPDRVFIDLPEPDGERFINKVKSELPEKFRDIEFVAEHGADSEYPVVSAASIIAKTAREEHVEELKGKYGFDFKSGYSHDPESVEFLEKYLDEHGELPPEARKSWETAQRVLRERSQSSVGDF